MRLTTNEILEKFPSMNFSGKNYNTVQGRYYGDMPHCILRIESNHSYDKNISNSESADVFIAKCYAPDPVEKYRFHNGCGYRIKDGQVIAGKISILYGGGYPYIMEPFNNHCGSTGFRIAKPDIGKYTYSAYNSPGYNYNPWNPKYCRKTLDGEIVEKLFRKVETNEEYGKFARFLLQTAKKIQENARKNAA